MAQKFYDSSYRYQFVQDPDITSQPQFAEDDFSHYSSKAYAKVASDERHRPDNEADQISEAISSTTSIIRRKPLSTIGSHSTESFTWLPYALRWYWLLTVLCLGTALLVATLAIHIVSNRNQGLVEDHERRSVYFLYRFTPTLLAVVYATMLMIVLDAVKRTEPFARLSSPGGATVGSSVMQSPGLWWTTLINSFPSKSKERQFSPTMLGATIAYILAILVISPFSSALLAVHSVVVSSTTTFQRAQLPTSGLLSQGLETQDYFQTIGHMLQNVTTSSWITDEFVVVPFWPNGAQRNSGMNLVPENETWTMETTVIQVETTCQELKLEAGPINTNFTYKLSPTSNYSSSVNLTSYKFVGDDGCRYGVAADYFYASDKPSQSQIYGIMYWSNLTVPTVPLAGKLLFTNDKTTPEQQLQLLNSTSQCQGSIMAILPPKNSTLRAAAHICTSNFYKALMPVTLSSANGFSATVFSNETFMEKRRLIDKREMDIDAFEESFIGTLWNAHLLGPLTFDVNSPQLTGGRPKLGGPANVLAGMYDFDLQRLLTDPGYMLKAKQLKQRAFGQTVASAIAKSAESDTDTGHVRESTRKVVVSSLAAIILEISFAATIILIFVVLICSRLARRPLGLSQDPAFTNTIATASSAVTPLNLSLRSQKNPQECSLDPNQRFALQNGILEPSRTPYLPQSSTLDQTTWKQYQSNTRPLIISTPIIILLLTYLGALLATISVLYWYSKTHGISKAAITPHFIRDQSTSFMGTIAPYAIVPTLLAVGLGLWWGALEGVFRIALPYIMMCRRPTRSSHGSGLSYQSSYLAWAAVRAASRRHWLLLFVCAGASLSQILTIAISALWSPIIHQNQHIISATLPLQLREVPIVFSGNSYNSNGRSAILASIYANVTTDFMFGGLSELKFNASQPAWSKDDWSFLPTLTTGISPFREQDRAFPRLLDVETEAIRARLECSPFASQGGPEYYTREANMSSYNLTEGPAIHGKGYTLTTALALKPYNLTEYYFNSSKSWMDYSGGRIDEPSTRMFQSGIRMACCAGDEKGAVSEAIVGYWSSINLNLNTSYWSQRTEQTFQNFLTQNRNFNFTTKWIHGPPPSNYVSDKWYTPELLWPEPPEIDAVNCMPIIESSRARITVDLSNSQVRNYTIIKDPAPYPYAWTDNFVAHDQRRKSGDFNGTYTTSFGPLFLHTLLSAGQIQYSSECADKSGQGCVEQDNDRVYNIKQPGLNVDFMSYAMLSLVNDNFTQLLDQNTMIKAAQKVFPIFFKHFVGRSALTGDKGGYVYQRSDEAVPADLGPVNYPYNMTTLSPARVTNPPPASVTAVLSDPVELLQMSPVAVWICIVILVWLLITVAFVLLLKDKYFKPLLRGVDTIFDTMVMVAGSDRYLELARTRGATGLRRDKNFRTRLGWFRTGSGQVRWGIELADHPDVEFLNDQEVHQHLSSGKAEIYEDSKMVQVHQKSEQHQYEMRLLQRLER